MPRGSGQTSIRLTELPGGEAELFFLATRIEAPGEVRMKTQWSVGNGRDAGSKSLRAFQAAVMGLLFVAALPLAAQDKQEEGAANPESDRDSIGFIASKNATPKEVGLPMYPGARRHKDESDDSPAVQLGLWGGNSGFKLVVLKLESDDAPGKVASFYRHALAKYGEVLECTGSSKAAAHEDKPSRGLDCEGDQPDPGGLILKAGTKEEQHIVGIKPNGAHSVFQLVFLMSRDSGGKK